MLLIQALIIFYAFASAKQEAKVVKAFRDYVPLNNPYVKDFHKWGACMTAALAVVCALHADNFWMAVTVYAVSLLLYWLVFDIALNILTKGWKEWAYIGQTAAIDKFLNRYFEEDGGKYKAAFCVVIITLLNLILLKIRI